MNLLIINFETDELHGALAWQAKVIKEISKHCKKVVVVTSRIGKFDTPPNVVMFQIPMRPLKIPQRIGGEWALNWHIYQLCRQHKVDAIFIHMAHKWAYRLYPAVLLLKIPVVIWYAHISVTQSLKWAVRCAERVITSAPGGCRIDSPKVKIIGQGIDTELFQIPKNRKPKNILHVGRISHRKRIDLLIDVAAVIKKRNNIPDFKLELVGPVLSPEDIKYDWQMRNSILKQDIQDCVDIVGYVPFEYLPKYYENTALHLNVCETASIEKSIAEALSAGCPVLTTNPAFKNILKDYPEFIIKDNRPEAIAEQVEHIFKHWDQYDPEKLRALIEGKHDLHSYATRVLSQIKECI
jgi:glycosyltransferase involved in cell wall biosynthesis